MEIEKKLSKQLSMPVDSVDDQNSDINQSLIQKDKIQKNSKIDIHKDKEEKKEYASHNQIDIKVKKYTKKYESI